MLVLASPHIMISSFFSGLSSPLRAWRYTVARPKLWPLCMSPLAISIAFLWGAWSLWDHIDSDFLLMLGGGGEDWWSSTLEGLSIMVFAVFSWYTFSMVGMVLASPFNDMLAVAVMKERGLEVEEPPFWEGVVRAIRDSLKLMGLKLSLSVLSFFLPPIFIPVFVFIIALDHFDYPWSHQTKGLRGRFRCLSRDKTEFLGFGLVFSCLMMFPFLGLLMMPFAVVASSLLVKE